MQYPDSGEDLGVVEGSLYALTSACAASAATRRGRPLRRVHDVPDDLPGPVHPSRPPRARTTARKYPKSSRSTNCGAHLLRRMCEEACPVDMNSRPSDCRYAELIFDKGLHMYDVTIGKEAV